MTSIFYTNGCQPSGAAQDTKSFDAAVATTSSFQTPFNEMGVELECSQTSLSRKPGTEEKGMRILTAAYAERKGRRGSGEVDTDEQKFRQELLRDYHAALRDIQGLGAEPTRMYFGEAQNKGREST